MTRAEFSAGWKLLILQPWGWRYRSVDSDGKPSRESLLQLELYYSKLKWADARAWQDVVALYVEGDEWPSIQALKTSLQQVNPRYVKAIGGKDERAGDPAISREAAQAILSRLGLGVKL